MLYPRMVLHMLFKTTLSCLLILYLFNSEGWGGSVARAMAAKVSMTMFIQSKWITWKGEAPRVHAPIVIIVKALMFTVI